MNVWGSGSAFPIIVPIMPFPRKRPELSDVRLVLFFQIWVERVSTRSEGPDAGLLARPFAIHVRGSIIICLL